MTRVYLGSFEGGLNHLVVPAPVLKRANDALDQQAEDARRQAEAASIALSRARATRAAGAMRRLRKALNVIQRSFR
jgi:hypothetical protein